MFDRTKAKVIRIGDRCIGGDYPIAIQSMCNTKTEDVKATVAQILALEAAGCEIIRVTDANAPIALQAARYALETPYVVTDMK